MLTSFIPVTEKAPVYPQAHVIEMVGRTENQLPEINRDGAKMFLCDLFGVTDLYELVDSQNLLDHHEVQPAVSLSEFDILASRVLPYFGPEIDAFHRKQAIRGVINCVPKTVGDLIDYLHPQDVSNINGVFATAGNVDDAFRPTPVPALMAERDPKTVEMAGSIVMSMQNKKGCPECDDMPDRQNLLRRAAEFYLLHLYHHRVASLWLAKYINPLTFCHCPNTDCEGRAFGFADAHGMVELVLQSMGYIREMFERDEQAMVTEKEVSVSEIKTSYLELIMDAVEVLLIIDQSRERASDVKRLLTFVAGQKDITPDIEHCRALIFASVAWDLYGCDAPVPELFVDILPPPNALTGFLEGDSYR